jgi:hypothetical protein
MKTKIYLFSHIFCFFAIDNFVFFFFVANTMNTCLVYIYALILHAMYNCAVSFLKYSVTFYLLYSS